MEENNDKKPPLTGEQVQKQTSDTSPPDAGLVDVADAETEVLDLIVFACPHCQKEYDVLARTLDEIGVDYYDGFMFTCDNDKCRKMFRVIGY